MDGRKFKFYEFFAGGGMARLGLGEKWTCLFANDFSPRKAESYRANFHPTPAEFSPLDVYDLTVADLPDAADLAWASFPCQDLSLAGAGQGLYGARSGSFWGFWRLVQELSNLGRPIPLVVLENVTGTITSNQGNDFVVLLDELTKAGYRTGPLVIDAQYFVPQSRPRLFIIAAHSSVQLPKAIVQAHPDSRWHSVQLRNAYQRMPQHIKDQWLWWNLPYPAPRAAKFENILEHEPTGVLWHTPEQTQRLLDLMSPLHKARVLAAQENGERVVGTIYRRIRTSAGVKQQRAEIRMDDISGCLRTGSGGSSKQFLMVIEGHQVRSRLLSAREAARLMGVDDSYELPSRYSDAYHLFGDGLVVPVVSWVSEHLLTPALTPGWYVEEAYPYKHDGCQTKFLEKISAQNELVIMGAPTMRDEVNQKLHEFRTTHQVTSKGSLSLMLHITRFARETGLPLDPDSLLTRQGGQVKSASGGRIKKILAEYGIFQPLSTEGGRTSRGSLDKMRAYAVLLNEMQQSGDADLEAVEAWWVDRVRDYFASTPFSLVLDGSLSFEAVIRALLAQVAKRQQETPGATLVGAVLQHLVGAKLELLLEASGETVQHHGASVADSPGNRSGDFLVGDTVIHVTTAPSEALMQKCKDNIASRKKPVVITLCSQVPMAKGNAELAGVQDRVEILAIEQFLTSNIYEHSGFQSSRQFHTVEQLLLRYNRIIDAVEHNPSLHIHIGS